MRAARHREFQHLRINLNPIGQPSALPRPAPVLGGGGGRLDEHAHEREIPPLDGEPDRERVPAARGRTVVEEEAHEGYGASVHGTRKWIAVVRVCIRVGPLLLLLLRLRLPCLCTCTRTVQDAQ